MVPESIIRGEIVRLCNEHSQAEMARRFGVSRAYINDIVAGRRRVSKRIAGAMGYRVSGQSMPVERQFEPIPE